jgi:hypothetical protein
MAEQKWWSPACWLLLWMISTLICRSQIYWRPAGNKMGIKAPLRLSDQFRRQGSNGMQLIVLQNQWTIICFSWGKRRWCQHERMGRHFLHSQAVKP